MNKHTELQSKQIGQHCVCLFQVVEQQLSKDFTRHFVVVGFTARGVLVDDPDFDGERFEIRDEQFVESEYRPLVAEDGTPVWGW